MNMPDAVTSEGMDSTFPDESLATKLALILFVLLLAMSLRSISLFDQIGSSAGDGRHVGQRVRLRGVAQLRRVAVVGDVDELDLDARFLLVLRHHLLPARVLPRNRGDPERQRLGGPARVGAPSAGGEQQGTCRGNGSEGSQAAHTAAAESAGTPHTHSGHLRSLFFGRGRSTGPTEAARVHFAGKLLSGGTASPDRVVHAGRHPRPFWPSPHGHALVRLPYVEYGREARPKSASRPT